MPVIQPQFFHFEKIAMVFLARVPKRQELKLTATLPCTLIWNTEQGSALGEEDSHREPHQKSRALGQVS